MDTIEGIRNYLIAQGIEIEENCVYNLYKCGHVVLNSEDPKKQYFTPGEKNYHGCPYCRGRFRIKYKKCACGLEYIGSRQQDGFCKACGPARRKGIQYVKDHMLQREILQHRAASRQRYNCAHRDACLNASILRDPDAKTLLCHECTRYQPVRFHLSEGAFLKEKNYRRKRFYF